MAKIKVLGNSLTIISGVKAEDIIKTKDIKPEFTQLYEQKIDSPIPEVTFAVGMTEGAGSVSTNGIVFDSVNAEGYAYLTLSIDRDPEMTKEDVAAFYAPTMVKLNAVEARIAEGIASINSDVAAVTEAVTIVE